MRTTSWQGAEGARRSPAWWLALAVALLGLNLLHDDADLFGFSTEPSHQLFTWLLRAAKTAEPNVVGMLLTAVDAESHAAWWACLASTLLPSHLDKEAPGVQLGGHGTLVEVFPTRIVHHVPRLDTGVHQFLNQASEFSLNG